MAKFDVRQVAEITADTTNYRVQDPLSGGFTSSMDSLVQGRVNSIFNKIDSYIENVAKKSYIGSSRAEDTSSGSSRFRTYTEIGKGQESFDVLKAQRTSFVPDKKSVNDEGIALDYQKAYMLTTKKRLHSADEYNLLNQEISELGGRVSRRKLKKGGYEATIEVPISESDYNQTQGMTAKQKSSFFSDYLKQLSPQTNALYRSNSAQISAETRAKNKELAEKDKAKQEEKEKKDKEEEEKNKEKADKENKKKLLSAVSMVITALVTIADIARRILTATLARASEVKKEAVDAKSLGVTQMSLMKYNNQETVMGLPRDIFKGAIGSLQRSFGDISNLDTKAVSELAKVLGSDIAQTINVALGRNDPESAMKLILDTYFERGRKGINSVGMQVGQMQSERELATALENAGLNELATILRSMFYTNDTGIYRGSLNNVDPFDTYMNLVQMYTMGLTDVDNRHVAELGQVVDQLKAKFDSLKDNLEKGLLLSLENVINKINNWDIGKSDKEKVIDLRKSIVSNEQARDLMLQKQNTAQQAYRANFDKANINFKAMGFSSVDNLLDTMRKDDYWTDKLPKTDEAQKQYQRFINFLATDEGLETLQLIRYAEVTGDRAKQAQSDWEKTVQGKTTYQPSLYTEASLQEEAMNYGDTWTVYNGDVVSPLLYKSAVAKGYGGRVDSYFSQPKEVFDTVKSVLGIEKFTYDYALASKNAKNLTNDLYKKLQVEGAFADEKAFSGLQTKGLGVNKEAVVKRAFDKGILTQDYLDSFMMSLTNTTGYGIANDLWSKVSSYVESEGAQSFMYSAGAISALNDAINTNLAQSFLARTNGEGITASVGGYNEKTGTVTVTLIAKDTEGKQISQPITFNTDAILGKDKTYTYDFNSNITRATAQ